MGFFSKIGSAITSGAKAVLSGAKAVVSNPIVSTVANLVAPGAFKLATNAVNTAAGIIAPAAPAPMPAPARVVQLVASPSPNAAPAVGSFKASSGSKGLGGLIEKIAPNYGRNTDAIVRAFRRV